MAKKLLVCIERPVQLSSSSAKRPGLILQSPKFLLILATPTKGVLAYYRTTDRDREWSTLTQIPEIGRAAAPPFV